MVNSSLTLLPADKQDTEATARSLQTVLDTVNLLAGNTKKPATKQLSKLEVQTVEISSLPQVIAEIQQLQSTVSALSSQVEALQAELAEPEANSRTFTKVPSFDLNSESWSVAQGLFVGATAGSNLSNIPSLVLSPSEQYLLLLEVDSLSAFWQTMQIQGNSENRVFVRAGTSFTDAVSRGWKEL